MVLIQTFELFSEILLTWKFFENSKDKIHFQATYRDFAWKFGLNRKNIFASLIWSVKTDCNQLKNNLSQQKWLSTQFLASFWNNYKNNKIRTRSFTHYGFPFFWFFIFLSLVLLLTSEIGMKQISQRRLEGVFSSEADWGTLRSRLG